MSLWAGPRRIAAEDRWAEANGIHLRRRPGGIATSFDLLGLDAAGRGNGSPSSAEALPPGLRRLGRSPEQPTG
jgi:hypothetical protein